MVQPCKNIPSIMYSLISKPIEYYVTLLLVIWYKNITKRDEIKST